LLTTEPTSTIPPGRRSTVLQRLQKIVAAPTVGPALALLATMAFFSFKSDRFFQAENLSLVLQQVMVVGVLAIGQTLVILTAGIDLSVGTVMALGQIVMTKLAIVSGMPALPALLLGVLTCIGFGVLNGGLVTLVRLPSFIVTLGTLNIAFALTHVVSNNETHTGLPGVLLFFGRSFSIGNARVTYGVVLMLALYALAWFGLTQTAWGRHV
jgi:fructose transport system permease protein